MPVVALFVFVWLPLTVAATRWIAADFATVTPRARSISAGKGNPLN